MKEFTLIIPAIPSIFIFVYYMYQIAKEFDLNYNNYAWTKGFWKDIFLVSSDVYVIMAFFIFVFFE